MGPNSQDYDDVILQLSYIPIFSPFNEKMCKRKHCKLPNYIPKSDVSYYTLIADTKSGEFRNFFYLESEKEEIPQIFQFSRLEQWQYFKERLSLSFIFQINFACS